MSSNLNDSFFRFRMEFRSIDNYHFPAKSDDEFIAAMRNGSKLINASQVEIDCSRSSRAKVAIDNPTSVAYEYIHIITNIFKTFLGLQPTTCPLLHFKKNHTTYYKSPNKFGLFGNALAAIGINETSKRGALHHHLCAWLGLHSRLLEYAAAFPDLVNEISEVINSQFQADIDSKYHVIDILSKQMKRSTARSTTVTIPSALVCRPCNDQDNHDPIVDNTEFYEASSLMATSLNIHQHSFTCFKGSSGKNGCRMSFPAPLIDSTKPVQLEENKQDGNLEQMGKYRVCEDIIPMNQNDVLLNSSRKRLTVYELKRTELLSPPDIPTHILNADESILRSFVVSKIKSIIQEASDKIVKVSTLMKWLENLTRDSLIRIYNIVKEELPQRNGLVVPFNDVMTVVLGCNSSVQFLGNAEQSRNSIYYLVPYLTKDNVSLSNCIPLIEKTYEEVLKRGSVAEDRGSDTRFAMHLATRLLNQLDTKSEISDTQAVASLLGMSAKVLTDTYWYFNPKHHIQFVKMSKNKQPDLMNFNDTDENLIGTPVYSDHSSLQSNTTSDNDTSSSVKSHESGSNPFQYIDIRPPDDINRDKGMHQNEVIFVTKAGNGTVFKRGNEKPQITIQPPYHYFYRGEMLAELTRVEYYTLIQIVPRKSNTKANHKDNNQGIKKGARFDFAESHVLYESHVQMIRFHQPTPIFANPTLVPRHPGKEIQRGKPDYEAFRERADLFSLYYLTLFRPEKNHFNAADKPNEYKYDWSALKGWIEHLRNDNKIISTCRLVQMTTYMQGLKTNTTLRILAKNYRDRNRRLWTETEKQQHNIYRSSQRLESRNDENTIDYDDYDIQRNMTNQQLRACLTLISYASSQLLTLSRLSSLNSTKIKSNSIKRLPLSIRKSNMTAIYRHGADLRHVAKQLSKEITLTEDSSEITNHSENGVSINIPYESSEERFFNELVFETNEFVKMNIEKNGQKRLGSSQKKVLKYWIHHLCNIKTKKHFNIYDRRFHDNRLVLLLGLPGTGKSFVIDAISKCVTFLKLGHVLKTAHFGVAAMNISGSTLHKTFKIPFGEGTNSKRALTEQTLIDTRRSINAENICMVIIDEISNVPPHFLQRVDSRLKQIMNCFTLPFGGLSMLLVGDFLQKEPPGATSLVKGLMHLVVHRDIRERKNDSPFTPSKNFPYTKSQMIGLTDISSNTNIGLHLFEKFQLFTLAEQQRASADQKHTAFLHKLSQNDTVVTSDDFKIYKILTTTDMRQKFSNATFIVSTNRERENIAFEMAQSFAVRNKRPLIRWRLEIRSWLNRPPFTQRNSLIDIDPIFYDHFVQGIEGYLTDNINISLMIGNGSKVKYHSLSFDSEDKTNIVERLIKKSNPGEIITLDFPPSCVNVELYQDKLKEDVKRKLHKVKIQTDDPELEGKIIIPLTPYRKAPNLKTMPTMITETCYQPARVSILPMFPLQLGAAVTVDKAQGRTIDKVVVCLSQKSNNILDMNRNSIFVALSRVQKRDDLRLLIHDKQNVRKELQYISQLETDQFYFDYLNGFEPSTNMDNPKEWNAVRAITELSKRNSKP